MVLENDTKQQPDQSILFKAKKAPLRPGKSFIYLVLFSTIQMYSIYSLCSITILSPLCVLGSPVIANLDSMKLEAVLNEDEGYHQIGPADLCKDFFVLSVTVAFASRLEQVTLVY